MPNAGVPTWHSCRMKTHRRVRTPIRDDVPVVPVARHRSVRV